MYKIKSIGHDMLIWQFLIRDMKFSISKLSKFLPVDYYLDSNFFFITFCWSSYNKQTSMFA